ncbi:MAG: helix-turn-helix domain-containing protein [Oscillospiraceae bacterium]
MVDEKFIIERIAKLRTTKNVSARDMSLSIGLSPNYINSIENGKSLPSMTVFLYICEYFKIEPKDFFDEGITEPSTFYKAMDTFKGLKKEQLELLIKVAKEMK